MRNGEDADEVGMQTVGWAVHQAKGPAGLVRHQGRGERYFLKMK